MRAQFAQFALTAHHRGLQTQHTFHSRCKNVTWSCGFHAAKRSCDFVGAIHDSVTNDAGGGGGGGTRALQLSRKHPRLIVESLPSSTLSCLTGWILNTPGKHFLAKLFSGMFLD